MNILRFPTIRSAYYIPLRYYGHKVYQPYRRMSDNNCPKSKSFPPNIPWKPPSEDAQLRDRLHLYNSFTRKNELFIPMHSNLVTWYSCGPTVYDSSHMGHARTYLSLDILRRVFTEYFGYNLLYVMNITDIDDKIIKRGRSRHLFQEYLSNLNVSKKIQLRDDLQDSLNALSGKISSENDKDKKKMLQDTFSDLEKSLSDAHQLIKMDCTSSELENLAIRAEFPLSQFLDSKFGSSVTDLSIFQRLSKQYEEEFHKDMRELGILEPDILTRVSEYVPEIVAFIQVLIDKKYAYESNGSVYFETARFHSASNHVYAKLLPEATQSQERLQEGEGELTIGDEKKTSQDFVLWKASKPGEPFWSSPWGRGRPGWHIECSAMATAVLGSRMDIHAGGVDLKFPHHDNEIAQTEAYFDSEQWINYFLHTGHLTINGCKMSKSLKNFVTIREALLHYSATQLRIFFLIHAWNSVLDYSSQALEEAQVYEATIKNFFLSLKARLLQMRETGTTGIKWSERELKLQTTFSDAQTQLHSALCDSVNTSVAMKLLRNLISSVNVYISNADTAHLQMDSSLLLRIGNYIQKLFRIFGVLPTSQISFISSPLEESESEVGSFSMPLALLLGQFRHEVRQQARLTSNEGILKLCDQLRDEQLVDLGIQLEDKPDSSQNPYVVKLRSREEILAEREERSRQVKEKAMAKEKQRQIMKEKSEKAEAQRKIPPSQMFRVEEEVTKYSAFDEKGIPTHFQNGKEIQGKERKSLITKSEIQLKKYEKYLTEQTNTSSGTSS